MAMLKNVVAEGTGTLAEVPGYQVAGKTGTASKPDAHGGYSDSRYVASFVGVVPASRPRLVILVSVDEPQGAIWGGVVAAPAFSQIAKFGLQYLDGGIQPDAPSDGELRGTSRLGSRTTVRPASSPRRAYRRGAHVSVTERTKVLQTSRFRRRDRRRSRLSPLVDSRRDGLERVIAALAPVDVLGRAPVEIADLAYDARAATPGSALLLRAGQPRRRARLRRARRWRTAPSRSSSSGRSSSRCRSSSCEDARRRWRVAADEFFGRPDRGARGRRRHRHEREDDDRVPALLDPRRRRPAARPARDDREPGRRRAAAGRADDAGGDRPPADVPRDARRRRPQLRDRGDLARLGARPARPRSLRRARLHEPEPGPPRLPRDDGATTSTAKRRLFTEAPAAGRGQRRRRVRAAAGGGAARTRPPLLTFGFADDADFGPKGSTSARAGARSPPAGSSSRRGCAAASTSRTCSARSRPARLLGIDDEAIARGVEELRGVPGRFEAVDEGQPFAVLVDYAHTPDSLENVLRTARELATGPPDLRLRLRRRPRSRQAPADGPDRVGARRRRHRHLGQPAQRGAATRSSARSSPGIGRGRGRARPARGDRACDRRGRARATWS